MMRNETVWIVVPAIGFAILLATIVLLIGRWYPRSDRTTPVIPL